MSRVEIIELLESLRLPEEALKDTRVLAETKNSTVIEDRSPFLNDPALYSNKEPFVLYDRNNETVITRTTKGINNGILNPFEINWMEVTLYETEFVRDVLERLDSIFMKDVAQAIDDEDVRHAQEDGQYTLIVSNSFGTGKGNPNQYSYTRDNWSNGDNYLSAATIAEGILDKRNKAEEYRKKLEQQKKTDDSGEKRNAKSVSPEFEANTEELLQQIAELKTQVNQLAGEKATFEKNNHDLVAREEQHRNEKDKAWAENQKLLDKIAELENKLEGKNDEPVFNPEDIMIAEDRKIDVIKILHAMCKIGLLQKTNGSKITQNAVMEYFGKMLNDDFSKYNSNLSTSKSKTKEPSYMQVFDDLRQAAYDYFKKS